MPNHPLLGVLVIGHALDCWLGVDPGYKWAAVRCACKKSLIAMSYLIIGLFIFSFCDDFSWLMRARILAGFAVQLFVQVSSAE